MERQSCPVSFKIFRPSAHSVHFQNWPQNQASQKIVPPIQTTEKCLFFRLKFGADSEQLWRSIEQFCPILSSILRLGHLRCGYWTNEKNCQLCLIKDKSFLNRESTIYQYTVPRLQIFQQSTMFSQILIRGTSSPCSWHKANGTLRCDSNEYLYCIMVFIATEGLGSCKEIWKAFDTYFKAVNNYISVLSKGILETPWHGSQHLLSFWPNN